MHRYFPVLIAAVAILAVGILYAFVHHGETANTAPVQRTETR
ncbi:hypothetical protein [Methylobacterium marchantiae]|uniref:Efflux transporter periplasmic adaptor subunit n=1 Tax=Methylobacterium marchantiae TaxID=600331 RepID=A0ABW3X2K3_9HYPH|nr:hypothetical protein AIGOOFII_1049 [Methylobacterium marchantiae]